jgi:hypothetical protein
MSVNACAYAHTKNVELDSHVACNKEKRNIIFSLEKLKEQS